MRCAWPSRRLDVKAWQRQSMSRRCRHRPLNCPSPSARCRYRLWRDQLLLPRRHHLPVPRVCGAVLRRSGVQHGGGAHPCAVRLLRVRQLQLPVVLRIPAQRKRAHRLYSAGRNGTAGRPPAALPPRPGRMCHRHLCSRRRRAAAQSVPGNVHGDGPRQLLAALTGALGDGQPAGAALGILSLHLLADSAPTPRG